MENICSLNSSNSNEHMTCEIVVVHALIDVGDECERKLNSFNVFRSYKNFFSFIKVNIFFMSSVSNILFMLSA